MRKQRWSLSETHTIRPTLFNEFRLGYVRTRFENEPQEPGTNHTVLSGISGFVEQSSDFPGFPGLGITGSLGFNPNAFSPIRFRDNRHEIIDNVTWINGAHSMKFGAHFRRYDTATTNAARSRGDFTFNGTYSGNSWSDFLLGIPFQGRRTFPRNLFGIKYLYNEHFFFQDDWMIRWAGSSILFFRTLSFPPARWGLDGSLRRLDRNNLAPRAGLAWRPTGGTLVLRLGYGIFYGLIQGNRAESTGIVNAPFPG